MKNKKLFAILTLVCFMFTLMPVAAFAADEVTYTVGTVEVKDGIAAEVVASKEVTFKDLEMELYAGSELLTTLTLAKEYTTDTISGVFYTDASEHSGTWKQTAWDPTANVVPTKVVAYVDGKKVAEDTVTVADWGKVAGVYTIGAADAETSSFVAVDGDQTVRLNKAEKDGVKFALDLFDKFEYEIVNEDTVYIWAETANGTVTSALEVVGAEATQPIENVFAYKTDKSENIVTLKFARTGEYTVYASVANATEVKDLNKFDCDFSKITVKTAAADPEEYTAVLSYTYEDEKGNDVTVESSAADADTTFDEELTIVPNNVLSDKYFVNIYDADGKALKGATVTIETNSAAIEVNKASDVTNSQGEIDFKVSASVEGEYEIILSVDGVEWVVVVNVGNTAAAYIETVTEPTAPLALYDTMDNDVIEFQITDINGNEVKAFDSGMDGIKGNEGKYVVLTEAPADTDLESEALGLAYNGTNWYLTGVGTFDAEGKYAVKVILDNGAYATASWEVKKFQTPVMLVIGTSTDVIELGGAVNGELLYFDANGVQKVAKDVELAVTGYAVESAVKYAGTNNFKITVKDDEKYVDATVSATAVSEKYDLVATKDFTVADGAVAIAFVDKSADVNVNNKLEWNVVNSEGTRVALVGAENVTIKYVVLDKPADAKVSVNNVNTGTDLLDKGIGKMSLTSNKIGNVTVQVVMKAEYATTNNEVANQVKYYTGTQIIAVGTQSVGDVVVMSVGSNEIVINDAKATIDAAPVVENNRTFVPFRALAEAFGATVAYDEATQAVTAELNGVTVVMTIGSAEYTVNGVAKTADVAPFINGSRTMVPVRFAAEAFGIKVIPTYDENGATADILFNL